MSVSTQQSTSAPKSALTPSPVITVPATQATSSCQMAKPARTSTSVSAHPPSAARSARTVLAHTTANAPQGTSANRMDAPAVRTAASTHTSCIPIATTSAI